MSEEKDWQKLNDFQWNRLRTEVMFGSRDPHTQIVLDYDKSGKPVAKETTWVPAVYVAFREILDNALDEVVRHGHGTSVTVTYDAKTMVFSVADNGRGIPINFDKTENAYAATVLLSELKAGRNFGERGDSRGANGVGGSCVAICSEWFQLDIHRDKLHFSQRFHEGDCTDLTREDPVIKPEKKQKETGTRIEFKLSKQVFPHFILPERFLRARLVEVAACYPKLKVIFNGETIASKGSIEKTLLASHKAISFNIEVEGFDSRFWLVPGFFSDGSDLSHGLVNGMPVFEGGLHIDAFKNRFAAGLLAALEPQCKKLRLSPNKSDVNDNTYLFNLTQMVEPSFSSQSKVRLINDSAKKHVMKAMDDPDFFKSVIRAHPEWIKTIFDRCAERTRKTTGSVSAADKKKLKKRVEKLSDACAVNRSKCILFLAEGDSAVSGIVEARDPDIHGALPLSGKILNVTGESLRTILDNEALCQVMNAIGLVPGERANRHMLRYSQVYLTCDADPDGANIFALLINFFFTCWPELFDPDKPPFISVFDTPLIIASKGKARKYWYAEDYSKFDADAHKSYDIVRAKGLAALTREDWKIILKDPKKIPIYDDGRLAETMSLLFDEKRADDRKDWMGI